MARCPGQISVPASPRGWDAPLPCQEQAGASYRRAKPGHVQCVLLNNAEEKIHLVLPIACHFCGQLFRLRAAQYMGFFWWIRSSWSALSLVSEKPSSVPCSGGWSCSTSPERVESSRRYLGVIPLPVPFKRGYSQIPAVPTEMCYWRCVPFLQRAQDQYRRKLMQRVHQVYVRRVILTANMYEWLLLPQRRLQRTENVGLVAAVRGPGSL